MQFHLHLGNTSERTCKVLGRGPETEGAAPGMWDNL